MANRKSLRFSAIIFAWFLLLGQLCAADPAPLTEERRAQLVAQWRKAYDARLGELQEKAAIKTQKADPFSAAGVIGRKAKPDQLGKLAANSARVVRSDDKGTLIDVQYVERGVASGTGFNVTAGDDEVVTARFLVYPPIKGAIATGKIDVPGLWYVSDTATIGGKEVLVVQRVEVKKEEMPSK